jgi:hypothetical protein
MPLALAQSDDHEEFSTGSGYELFVITGEPVGRL